jgi:thiol-disulfide isomerase/thioredoxin
MNFNEIKNKISNAAGSKQNVLIIILVVLIFLIAALFAYRRFVAQRLSKNKNSYVNNNEFNEQQGIQSADIYFFYTTWCPHCKTAKPVWEDFKSQMGGKSVNGVTLNFFEVDCDKDQATADKFNVKGYPTIKLMKGNKIIEYDAKPSTATLIQFVNSSL